MKPQEQAKHAHAHSQESRRLWRNSGDSMINDCGFESEKIYIDPRPITEDFRNYILDAILAVHEIEFANEECIEVDMFTWYAFKAQLDKSGSIETIIDNTHGRTWTNISCRNTCQKLFDAKHAYLACGKCEKHIHTTYDLPKTPTIDILQNISATVQQIKYDESDEVVHCIQMMLQLYEGMKEIPEYLIDMDAATIARKFGIDKEEAKHKIQSMIRRTP